MKLLTKSTKTATNFFLWEWSCTNNKMRATGCGVCYFFDPNGRTEQCCLFLAPVSTLLNCVHNCNDHSSLDFKSAVQYMKHFIYHFTIPMSLSKILTSYHALALSRSHGVLGLAEISNLESRIF